MTERLYYDDSYLTHFSARVIERLEWDGQPAVVLDRTAFYPTGGGQPHDTGTLSDVPVTVVVEREGDGAVVHLLSEPLATDKVEGRVNWKRRFDLMQQHTGQHLLSAAFGERLDANTVGFHLAEEYATIDLDRAPLSVDELAEVEDRTNAIVFQDRRVVARFVPDEQVPNLPLRRPLSHEGPVRVVEVPRFDCAACGGTHVATTGQIGLIKITRTERRGTETRVEFLCGGRALGDYRTKNALLMDLAQEFTVGYWQVADMVRRTAAELKEVTHELRHTRDDLLDVEARTLWHEASHLGPVRVVNAVLSGRSMDDLKHLAQRLIARPQTVALLASGGPAEEKGYLVFARSDDVDVNMGTLVRRACEAIDGRGGGRPEFAQGGGLRGDRMAEAVEVALQALPDFEG